MRLTAATAGPLRPRLLPQPLPPALPTVDLPSRRSLTVKAVSSSRGNAAQSSSFASPGSASSRPSPRTFQQASGQRSVYRVQPGDTLSRIAAKHGLTLSQLLALNAGMDEVIVEGQEVNVPSGSRQGGLVTSVSEGWRGSHSSFPNQPQSGSAAGPLSRFLLYGLAVAALVVAVKGFLSRHSTTEEVDLEKRGSLLQPATSARADRARATGSAGVTQRSMSKDAGEDGTASVPRAAAAMADRHGVLQQPRAAEQSTPKRQVGESRQAAEEGGRSLEQALRDAQASSQTQLAEKQQKLEELAAQLERAVMKSKEVESLQRKAVEEREQADLASKRAAEDLQKLEVSHAALAAQVEELQGKLQAAMQEKKEEAARRATLEDAERKKENEVNRLQQAVQEMEGRLSETSQQLGAVQKESEDVRAKLEAQLEEVAGQVAALKRQGKEASDAEEQLISQMEREHEDEMGSLKAVAAVEKRVLEEQVEELKRKLKKAARPGAAVADSMETLQREMNEKEQQLSVTRELVEHYMKVDKERDQRIVELERRIAGSQELVDDLRRSVEAAAARSLVKVLEPEGDAGEDLDQLREHMEQSEAGHREEVKGLLSQLDASQSLAKKLEAQIHEAKEMLATEKVRSKEAAGKVDSMELQSKELASAVQMAKELESRANQVEGLLKRRETELLKASEEREQKVTQAQEEIESLKTAVEKERQMRLASQAKVGVSDDVLRPVVQENKRLKEELAQARAGVAAAESENQKLARDLEGVSTRLREAEDVKLKRQQASAAEAEIARELAQQREQAAAQAREEARTELQKAMNLLKKRDSTVEEMKAEAVRTAKQMEQLKSEAAEALAAKQRGAAELEMVRAEVHEARVKLTAREEAGIELQKAMSLLKKRDSTIEEMKAEAIRTAKQMEQLKSEAAEALAAKQRGATELERFRAEVHEARAKLTTREPDQAGTVGNLQPSESTVSLTELVLRHRGMLADAEQAFNQALGTDITPSPDAWELLGDVEALREQLSLLEERLQSALEAQVIQAQQREQELEANLSVMKQREADLVSQLEQARALSEEQAGLSARQEVERQGVSQGAQQVQQTLTALQSQLAELKAQYDVQGGQLKLFKRQAESVLKERDEVTQALKQRHQQEIAQLKEDLMQEFRKTTEAPREVLEEGAGKQWTKELEHEAARISKQEPGSRTARSITRPELEKGPTDDAAAPTQALAGLDERLRAAEDKAEQLATEVRQRVTRQMEWTGGPTELSKSDGNGSYNSKGDVQRAQEIKERVAAMWQQMLPKNTNRDP
eukprot:SM000260S09944  [mRNA]  locus=s260:18158:23511:- [translate_table: standard]